MLLPAEAVDCDVIAIATPSLLIWGHEISLPTVKILYVF